MRAAGFYSWLHRSVENLPMRLSRETRRNGRLYRVYDDGYRKIVRTGQGNHCQSIVTPRGWPTHAYYDDIVKLVPNGSSVLILGNGAGSVMHQLGADCTVYGVENDPEMVAIGRWLKTDTDGTVIEADALEYARTCDVTFDVVIVDTYHDELPVAEWDAVVDAAKECVRPGGLLIVNHYDGANRIHAVVL